MKQAPIVTATEGKTKFAGICIPKHIPTYIDMQVRRELGMTSGYVWTGCGCGGLGGWCEVVLRVWGDGMGWDGGGAGVYCKLFACIHILHAGKIGVWRCEGEEDWMDGTWMGMYVCISSVCVAAAVCCLLCISSNGYHAFVPRGTPFQLHGPADAIACQRLSLVQRPVSRDI